jgi:5-bromo-4-chloroindolyl phosphate hydrolysis protein
MGRAEQSELNVSREHRLHRPPSDDVNELRVEIVFAKNSLFLRNP